MTWHTIIVVDWSGGNDRGPRPTHDAIWAGIQRGDHSDAPRYFRNRATFSDWIIPTLEAELRTERRVVLGFDFPFAYPNGFGRHLTKSDDPFAVWDWFATRVTDTPKANNRFDLAGQINETLPGIGPFWGNGLKRDIPHLPRKGLARTNTSFPEKRGVETITKGAFTCWQLAGAGAVGSQVIMGLPVLHKLRQAFAGQINVWPFEPLTCPIALVEVWPTLFAGPTPAGMIKDAHQVQATARALYKRFSSPDHTDLQINSPVEGWILGVDQPQTVPWV